VYNDLMQYRFYYNIVSNTKYILVIKRFTTNDNNTTSETEYRMSTPVVQHHQQQELLRSIQAALNQYNILDTESEEIYDDISEIAAELCQAPMAFVSFVDHTNDRVYLKSTFSGTCCIKADDAPNGSREHGSRAFCAECILQDDVFVIENPLDHPYFKRNPYVIGGPCVRFYAGAPLKSPSGANIGTVCIADIKHRTLTLKQLRCLKQLARQVVSHLELRKSIQRLEAVEKVLIEKNKHLDNLHVEKNKFLGMVSHDIRQPLANIMVSCELMIDNPKEKLSQHTHDLALAIHSSANFMHVLVEDLLQVVKFDYGQLTIELDQQYWDIQKLINNSIVCNTIFAQRKKINLEFTSNNQGTTPITCFVDEHKIAQVMNNLISNALKFSYPGTTVQVAVTKCSDSVLIEVKDEGQGIPQSEIHKLFCPFERIRGVRPTGGESSTCLGLVIVKTIVQAHIGSITVESESGVGSMFKVSLPLPHGSLNTVITRQVTHTSPAEPPNNCDISDQNHLRILAADDSPVNLQLFRKVLEKRGHTVILCSDGQECLDTLFEVGINQFDLLIIDEEMPKLFGHEVIREIRATEKRNDDGIYLYSHLRILSISGHTSEEHVQKMLLSGADKCFGKPFNIHQLVHVVECQTSDS
jgi:signal transduction histidine kinase/CheY-like chemotaxis protein